MNVRDLLMAGDGVGTFMKLPTTTTVELVAIAGFDFVVIDMEHAPLTIDRAHEMIGAAHARGIPAFVRVPDHTPSLISRLLDADADAIVVPHVDTPDQASALVAAATFAPRGSRGYGPTVRAGAWGSDIQRYTETASVPVIIPQIESVGGLTRVDDIAAVLGILALFIGPVDLAISTGLDPSTDAFQQKVSAVRRAADGSGLPLGIATGTGPLNQSVGVDWVVASNDASLLLTGARSTLDQLRAPRTPGAP